MPETLSDAAVLAMAGEVITCPRCDAPLALFIKDALVGEGWSLEYQPMAVVERVTGLSRVRCCCGGRPSTSADNSGHIYEALAPRFYLRSGDWTGWRGMGGE